MTDKLIIINSNKEERYFISQKIVNAINAANKDNMTLKQISEIVENIKEKIPKTTKSLTVEDLHKLVDQTLSENKFSKTAMNYRKYHTFRKTLHSEINDIQAKINKDSFTKNQTYTNILKSNIEQKRNHLLKKYPNGLSEKLINYAIIKQLIHDENYELLDYYLTNY